MNLIKSLRTLGEISQGIKQSSLELQENYTKSSGKLHQMFRKILPEDLDNFTRKLNKFYQNFRKISSVGQFRRSSYNVQKSFTKNSEELNTNFRKTSPKK